MDDIFYNVNLPNIYVNFMSIMCTLKNSKPCAYCRIFRRKTIMLKHLIETFFSYRR